MWISHTIRHITLNSMNEEIGDQEKIILEQEGALIDVREVVHYV